MVSEFGSAPGSELEDQTNDIDRPANSEAGSRTDKQQNTISNVNPEKGAKGSADGGNNPNPAPDQRAKKKKKGSGRTRGSKKRGTGFEEYYCEPPITPGEYSQEQLIYNPANSFVSRIEECIQRYRARRRLDNEQENIFSKYMMLGGIDATVRQFQSTRLIDDDTIQESTKAELRGITADDVIQRGKSSPRFYNPSEQEHWEVDFAGVAAGFISVRLLAIVGPHPGWIQKGINIVLNFLKYVEFHDVCPEFADDINHAQSICNTALEEMPRVLRLAEHLPGDFNRAARTLFCHDEESDSIFLFDNQRQNQLMSEKQARAIFFGAVVAWTAPKFCSEILGTDIQVKGTFERVFEVLPLKEAWIPNATIVERYKRIRNQDGKPGSIRPTGSLFLKPSAVKDGWDTSKASDQDAGTFPFGDSTQFFMEMNLITRLTPGMKLRLVVCQLNIDMFFIKDVKDVYPTFYTFLPQELMLDYKEPVPNERPAPRVDEPEVADEDME